LIASSAILNIRRYSPFVRGVLASSIMISTLGNFQYLFIAFALDPIDKSMLVCNSSRSPSRKGMFKWLGLA